jgi:glycosyltransferase involved in cell wall biosynthesis
MTGAILREPSLERSRRAPTRSCVTARAADAILYARAGPSSARERAFVERCRSKVYRNSKVIVVMPAYNADRTLRQTYEEVMAQDYVDGIILVDDASRDRTVEIARELDRVALHRHDSNRGYGANQKTCYRLALDAGADIVIMVHPDYQYTPKLIPAMASMIGNGLYDCVIGSRILGGYALSGGMPWWRYVSNRLLTLVENLLTGAKLSEYHSGYRAFSRRALESLPLDANSDDFVFDNQMLAQILWMGYIVAEVSCPTRYHAEASSINFGRSVRYGLGCVLTGLQYFLAKRGWIGLKRFPPDRLASIPQS